MLSFHFSSVKYPNTSSPLPCFQELKYCLNSTLLHILAQLIFFPQTGPTSFCTCTSMMMCYFKSKFSTPWPQVCLVERLQILMELVIENLISIEVVGMIVGSRQHTSWISTWLTFPVDAFHGKWVIPFPGWESQVSSSLRESICTLHFRCSFFELYLMVSQN